PSFFLLLPLPPPPPTLFPYTTLFRSAADALCHASSLLHEPVSPTWPTQSSSFHLPSAGPPASLPSATSAAIWTSVLTAAPVPPRSEEHTSELHSLAYLVCRLLLEKKK